jgi:hypothetical protein
VSWHLLTVAGYALILLAGLTLAVVAHLPRSTVPDLGVLLTRITRTRAGRVAVLAAWLWLGLHFFAR